VKAKLKKFKQGKFYYRVYGIMTGIAILLSNLYLQWCQNYLSIDLVWKFAFSWHTEKFFLGCFVLSIVFLFLWSLSGSWRNGFISYSLGLAILGYANYQKLFYREEPIYPDDLKMVTEFGLLREMIGWLPLLVISAILIVVIYFFCKAIYRSLFFSWKYQGVRLVGLATSLVLGVYISDFNNGNNLLRQAYDRTALWIPYSQKMNYYNTGFIGGFLYNLKVAAMTKPSGYSKAAITAITKKYQDLAQQYEVSQEQESPNIIFVMSESFSDPSKLKGLSITGDPLKEYNDIAGQTFSGQMLSQSYGGGTANIEFEALTSFSMELLNSQLTSPYTMLIPKMSSFPSLISLLKKQNYATTAVHPYNTSMYKRKDVYRILGFDQFISEEAMQTISKLENNPYISDAAAYQEVIRILNEAARPQFVHLVTMQTHMPYENKYRISTYKATGTSDDLALTNYLQDIAYSSQALNQFVQTLNNLSRRTLVVFWGDHLPSIYDEGIKESNPKGALHQTEFLMYDTNNQLSEQHQHSAVISPFFFAPLLFQQSALQSSGFYTLLQQVQAELPAFEKGFYYLDNQWHSTLKMNARQEELYHEYQLIQYDIVAGKQYSLAESFFD